MRILTGVNEALILDVGSESYDERDDYSGTIEVDISEFVLTLIVMIVVLLAAAALVPDAVWWGRFLFGGGGYTIPIGRIVEQALISTIFLALSVKLLGGLRGLGRAGDPGLQGTDRGGDANGGAGLPAASAGDQERLAQHPEECTEIAKMELLWEASQAAPRQLTVLNDWALEVGDIVQIRSPAG